MTRNATVEQDSSGTKGDEESLNNHIKTKVHDIERIIDPGTGCSFGTKRRLGSRSENGMLASLSNTIDDNLQIFR